MKDGNATLEYSPDDIASQIVRARGFGLRYPSRAQAHDFIDRLLGLILPHYGPPLAAPNVPLSSQSAAEMVKETTRLLVGLLEQIPEQSKKQTPSAREIAGNFMRALPRIQATIQADARAIFEGDPAAESLDEVIVAYPGFFAIAVYRVAHEFHHLGVAIFPRLLTELAHQLTGIDIHPGAAIGEKFCIDHGTGIVVGETSCIGNEVKIYQGVTLGALSVEKSLARAKRHPTIEDRVVVYSNATILGGDTVIGHDSIIGGNVWLTESVPPFSTVYHRSEITVRSPSPGTS